MSSTRVKICGITREADARAAAAAGADAIGLVFYPGSPRAVSLEQAKKIVENVPPFVTIVALFVDEPADVVMRTLEQVAVDVIQFHGDETPEFCAQFSRPWIKALRMKPGLDVAREFGQFTGARGVLLDTWQEGKPGGTGHAFDWSLVSSDSYSLPLVLAGGLHAENVAAAITTVRPAAVDVSGGVESAPGIKDAAKIRRFISAVRSVR
ncbi:phosphoribosylanthranilate isomerase [Candidatus Marimicrobium litorale]|uniref:N-(5'-phosphoribosyl)anthranilate isomerase n=1 Tax=Candidatus Marimicrobium litorale TaxID=2518991 RepID=A0ABT3T216_9GAMM|nr:phosphoribosylanthranilate isomerase [Candidatus Marimicrobium litorale]MCX2976293.1 phosphoribosylanthranilate isomerase [Candidatus Marimicrobium litorale]